MDASLLRIALDQAVAKHFSQLFEVLMVTADEQGMRRFQKGLHKLVQAEADVANVIATLEGEP